MGSSQKIVSAVVWSTVCNIVNAIYGFVAVPILINYFGKAEYGLIGLAMSVNVYLQLMDMGLNSTNVRFYSKWYAEGDYSRLNKGFRTSLSFYGFVGFINALILVIVGVFCNNLFNVSIEQGVILRHLFFILAISAFCQWFSSCYEQLIRATENIAWIQKVTLVTKLLMIAVLAGTVFGKFTIELYYILTCLATLSTVPFFIGKIKKELTFISLVPKWDGQSFKEMLPYCLSIFSFSIFQLSFYNLRPVFLGIEGTIESVADYRILNGIIGVVTMLGGAFTNVLLPSTSKICAQNNKEAYYRVAYDGTKYISILICFCCFGMMSVGPEVLTLYVGESYLHLVPWLNLWLLCTLVKHNQAISSLILAGSDIRAITVCTIIASVSGLVAAWLLIPSYNVGGTCVAFVIYASIQMLFYYLYYWPKKMGINSWIVFSKCFIIYVIIGVIAYLMVQFVPVAGNTFGIFLMKGVVFTVIFIISSFLTLSEEDRLFIKAKLF